MDEEAQGPDDRKPRRFLEPPKAFFSAALAKSPSMRIGKNDDVLIVTGGSFNYITLVGASHWSNVDKHIGPFDRFLGYIEECSHFANRKSTYPIGEELRDVRIRLLVGNRGGYENLEDDYIDLCNSFRRMLKSRPKTHQEFVDWDSNATRLRRIIADMKGFLDVKDLRFCRTMNGYLGLVPLATEIGDVICIVYGSCVPFVLRPCKDIKGAFRPVGQCYIHGIMEGEAMKMKDLVTREISLV